MKLLRRMSSRRWRLKLKRLKLSIEREMKRFTRTLKRVLALWDEMIKSYVTLASVFGCGSRISSSANCLLRATSLLSPWIFERNQRKLQQNSQTLPTSFNENLEAKDTKPPTIHYLMKIWAARRGEEIPHINRPRPRHDAASPIVCKDFHSWAPFMIATLWFTSLSLFRRLLLSPFERNSLRQTN